MLVFPDKLDFAIGIDNGLDGAIAIMPRTGHRVTFRDTPAIKGKTVGQVMTRDQEKKAAAAAKKGKPDKKKKSMARTYDFPFMLRIVYNLRKKLGWELSVIAVCEAPMIKGGFSGGGETGLGTVRSNQHGQSSWVHALGLVDIPMIEVASSRWKADMGVRGLEKAESVKVATKLFPGVEFARHDQAEAALLAHWLRTNYSPELLR